MSSALLAGPLVMKKNEPKVVPRTVSRTEESCTFQDFQAPLAAPSQTQIGIGLKHKMGFALVLSVCGLGKMGPRCGVEEERQQDGGGRADGEAAPGSRKSAGAKHNPSWRAPKLHCADGPEDTQPEELRKASPTFGKLYKQLSKTRDSHFLYNFENNF